MVCQPRLVQEQTDSFKKSQKKNRAPKWKAQLIKRNTKAHITLWGHLDLILMIPKTAWWTGKTKVETLDNKSGISFKHLVTGILNWKQLIFLTLCLSDINVFFVGQRHIRVPTRQKQKKSLGGSWAVTFIQHFIKVEKNN